MPKSKKQSKQPNNKTSFSRKLFKVLGILVPLLLMYWIFIVKIPSQVSYEQVWQTITSLSIEQNSLLIISGLLTVLTYGWTSATVLPGLSLKKGTQSAVSGQLTSVVLPAPVDLAIRFSMYKSYGFSIEKSTVAVGVAGIARYFTVFAIPLLGLAALLLTGQNEGYYVAWFFGMGAVFIFALWLMKRILSSKKSAQKVGQILQKLTIWGLKIVHKDTHKDLVGLTVDFGKRTRDVAVDYFKSIALSNIIWGLSCYLALFLAIRFCGIDSSTMSAAYILLITGLMLLFNAFPITPGGIGVTETILITIIPFPNPSVQAAFMSALFVYRIYTWLLPMPIGAATYFNWRSQQSKKKKIA